MGHATFYPPVRQVARTSRKLARQDGLPFAQHLPEKEINQAVHEAGTTFCERIFTPAVTLWTFLSQVFDADHSCAQAVARLLAFRISKGLQPCSSETSAYCKARKRLPEKALRTLVRNTGRELMDRGERRWLFKGRAVKVVDGTTVSMPDTSKNQKAYPKPSHFPDGVGFPIMRLVVIFSLAVGTVLDAAMGRFHGKRSGELSLFRTLDDVLDPGDILIGDRLFANFWDVARLHARGIDIVMRMHAGRSQVWFRGRGHSTGNRRLWWRKKKTRPEWLTPQAYDALPEWILLRAVRVDVRQRGFRTERLVLVTTLTDAEAYPAAEVAQLYRRRWHAELNLRSLKTILQMDILRCKSPAMVRKEVWAHLLVYNIVRTLMAKAAAQAGARPEEISFKGALQAFNAFWTHLLLASTVDEASQLWTIMMAAIAERRVGDRPDRYEPRAVRRSPKKYARLSMPRWRAHQLMKAGLKFKGDKG
jgi:Transposase DDE domain